MAESSETVVEDSDIYHDFACTLCAENDRNVEALKRCEECAENLCGECLRNHNMFKKMRTHTLVDKADIGKKQDGGGGAALPAVPNVKCGSHPGNRIELYCGDHDVVGCSTCTNLAHKLCKDMHYIPAVAAGYKNSDEPQAVAESVRQLVEKSKHLKQTGEDILKQITEEKDCSVELLNERAVIIMTMVDQLTDKATSDIVEHFQKLEQSVKGYISKTDDVISTVEAAEKKLNSADLTNESELFICTKQGKKEQETTEKLVKELEKSVIKEPFKVNVDDTVLTCLTNLKTFAVINPDVSQSLEEMTVITTSEEYAGDKPSEASSPKLTKHDKSVQTSPENVTRYKPDLSFSLQQKLNVRTKGDREVCAIHDCCLLENGYMVMTDVTNACLKLFDSSYKLLHRIAIDDVPWTLCTVGKGEIAVTVTSTKLVQFARITFNTKIHLTKYFVVGEVCRGISYSNHRLYISCGGKTADGEGPGQVRVYDTDGTLLQTVKANSSQHALSIPVRISAGINGDCVVANCRKGVNAFDSNGKLLWRFEHNKLKRATGVCKVDDKVITCCEETGNVFEISEDGQYSRILMHGSNVLRGPTSVTYNDYSGKLIITMYTSDHILVYNRR